MLNYLSVLLPNLYYLLFVLSHKGERMADIRKRLQPDPTGSSAGACDQRKNSFPNALVEGRQHEHVTHLGWRHLRVGRSLRSRRRVWNTYLAGRELNDTDIKSPLSFLSVDC